MKWFEPFGSVMNIIFGGIVWGLQAVQLDGEKAAGYL
jgi:hypothetical protein